MVLALSKHKNIGKYTVLAFQSPQSSVKCMVLALSGPKNIVNYMAFAFTKPQNHGFGLIKAQKHWKINDLGFPKPTAIAADPPLDLRLWHMVIWTSAFGIW